jgi:putative hemolysin
MFVEQDEQSIEKQTNQFSVAWCTDENELRAAQQLRYRVFGLEMGANLQTSLDQIDIDEYDTWCDHLIVKNPSGEVVGTYRVLRPETAIKIGKIYSDSEFDLSSLKHLRDRMIEVGRSCVDHDYRNGVVIMTLWSELAKFMIRNDYDHVLGCASVPMVDGGKMANRIYQHFLNSDAISNKFNVFPISPLPLMADAGAGADSLDIPPLLKGYLRLGAKICGAPALDTQFNTADFLTLLSIEDIPKRYARHFLVDKKTYYAAN